MQEKFHCLSKILKSQRKKLRISQQNIADTLDIDQSVYSRFEKDPEKMKIETLIMICNLLDLKVEIIIKQLF